MKLLRNIILAISLIIAPVSAYAQSSIQGQQVTVGGVPLPTVLGTKEATANKGQPNGYAGLDSTGTVPVAQSLVKSAAGRTGNIVFTHVDITDWSSTLAPYAILANLATVSTSGLYNDLRGLPTLGTAAAQDISAFDPAGSAASAVSAATATALQKSSNLTDLTNTAAARTALGLGTAATTAASAYDAAGSATTAQAASLQKSSNLSDVTNATTARTNISAAKSGSNSDITALTSLTTAVTIAQGGTGATTQSAAQAALGIGSAGLQSSSAFDPAGAAAAITASGIGAATTSALTAETSRATSAEGVANVAAAAAQTTANAAQTPTGNASNNTVIASGGITARTNAARAGDIFNVLDGYSGTTADNTGVNDTRLAINAAITAANAAGGGTVLLPRGTYYLNLSNGFIAPLSNVRLQGSSDGGTTLICDDTQGGSTQYRCLYNPASTIIKNFFIDHITFRGKADVAQSYNKDLTYIASCTNCGISNSEALYSRGFSFAFRQSDQISLINNRVQYSLTDCISAWDTPNVIISKNTILSCSDDSISAHSSDSIGAPVRSGITITDNVIQESQGIDVQGAKVASITGNTLKRMYGTGITVGSSTVYAQGDTVGFAISIKNNNITDVFARQDGSPSVANYYIVVSGGPKQVLVPSIGAVNTIGTFYVNNTNTSSTSPGGGWLDISNNILMRTLPAVTAVSNWGYNSGLWTGPYNSSTLYNGAIPEAALDGSGIYIIGPVRNSRIVDNLISTSGTGIYFGASTINNMDYDGLEIKNNTISDFNNRGIATGATSLTYQRIIIDNNMFDGDPRFVHTNRGTNGTWLVDSNPYGVYLPYFSGITLSRNSFKNVADPLSQGSAVWSIFENIEYGNPLGSASTFSTTNVGIGTYYKTNWLQITTDDNPNSSTFGSTLTPVVQNPQYVNLQSTGNFINGTNTLTGNIFAKVTGAAAYQHGWEMDTGGVARWRVTTSALAESGSNQGSDFEFDRLSDTGTLLDSPFTISRFNGTASFTDQLLLKSTIRSSGTAPTLSSCGTSPTITNGTDVSGSVIVGTGGTTTCAITFTSSKSISPTCTVSLEMGGVAPAYATSLTGIAITFSTSVTGVSFDYTCIGH